MERLFTDKQRRTYQNLCHLTERGVMCMMADFLRSKYPSLITTPNYIIALGNIPVALVAHADTVFKSPPSMEKFFYDQEKNVIWNPDGMGADDRAGVFAIMTILRETKLRPHVIISTGEESGCIGSGKLVAQYHSFPGELNFMIQLDRRGSVDSVFYDCDNYEFEDYVNNFGFKTNWGSFTDISVLAPMWKVAAVNFSIGYEEEHHEIEHLYVGHMFNTIEKVIKILEDQQINPKKFEYIEATYSYYWNSEGGLESYADHCRKAYGPGPMSYNVAPGWDEDDWDLPTGYGRCTFCQEVHQEADMIPIHFKYGKVPYHACVNCFGKHSDHILFCKKCGKGYYLGLTDLANEDPYNFICEDCKNEQGNDIRETGTPATGGESTSLEPRSAPSTQHHPVVVNLAKAKVPVYQKNEGINLGVSYPGDIGTGSSKQTNKGRRVH